MKAACNAIINTNRFKMVIITKDATGDIKRKTYSHY